MNRKPITLYKMDTISRPIRDGWELTPHGRLAWLHRLLWRLLVKLRAVGPRMTDEVKVIRLPLSGDGVVARIFEAREGLFATYREPKEILIGPDTLAELLNAPELRGYDSPFQFTGEMHNGRTLFSLPVTVLPQMEGVLVR